MYKPIQTEWHFSTTKQVHGFSLKDETESSLQILKIKCKSSTSHLIQTQDAGLQVPQPVNTCPESGIVNFSCCMNE
jgi:hypothetical protein